MSKYKTFIQRYIVRRCRGVCVCVCVCVLLCLVAVHLGNEDIFHPLIITTDIPGHTVSLQYYIHTDVTDFISLTSFEILFRRIWVRQWLEWEQSLMGVRWHIIAVHRLIGLRQSIFPALPAVVMTTGCMPVNVIEPVHGLELTCNVARFFSRYSATT